MAPNLRPPIEQLVAVTLLGGEPALPGEIGFMALGPPMPALFDATTGVQICLQIRRGLVLFPLKNPHKHKRILSENAQSHRQIFPRGAIGPDFA